jgi:hypothetical protein
MAKTLQSHDANAAKLHRQDTAKARGAYGKDMARTPHALCHAVRNARRGAWRNHIKSTAKYNSMMETAQLAKHSANFPNTLRTYAQ